MKSTNYRFYCITLDSFEKTNNKNDLVSNYVEYINIWSFSKRKNDKILKKYMKK